MNVNFTSEKYGDHEWLSLKVERMMSTESEAIELVTKMTFVEWGQALMNGSAICGRALVWTLLKREPGHRGMRFREVDFPIGDLKIELDDDEKQRIREELKRNPDIDEDDRRAIMIGLGYDDLDELEASLAELPDDPDGSGNSEATESVAESG